MDQSQLVAVPDDLPLDRACLLACGVITGVGAVLNTARLEPGSSAVVIGAGGVGLNAIQGAALAGALPIVAVDILPAEAARRAGRSGRRTPPTGARRTCRSLVRELTGGRGADYVFVTVGSPAAVSQALTLVRRGRDGRAGGYASGRRRRADPQWGLRRGRAPAPRQQHGVDPARRGRAAPGRTLP